MKAITFDGFGGDDKLKLIELPSPRPAAGQVVIRIRSAGVAKWDEMYIQGLIPPDKPKFPMVPGWEGAGTISALGEGVTDFREGDEVMYFHYSEGGPQGAWAEQAAVPVSRIARKPSSLSFEEAGGLPIISLTAFQALREGMAANSGQYVLICNGAGGVGNCAIQLARILGLKTIALASEPNHKLLKELGADYVFDYHKPFATEARKICPHGVDYVFDNIGNRETVAKAMPCLKAGGKFVTIVQQFEDLKRRDVESKFFEVHESGEQLAEMARFVDEGKLRVVIDRVYPLEKYRDALKEVESGHVHGKVVLKIA